MDFQRAKGVVILILCVGLITGVTYYLTSSYYQSAKYKEATIKARHDMGLKDVIVAAKDIPDGSVITASDLAIVEAPKDCVISEENSFKSTKEIINKVATVTIYKNEQVVKDKVADSKIDEEYLSDVETKDTDVPKLDPSTKYVTIDVPKYNFVNERVKVGSVVDILVDRGQGKYDVVMAKVSVLDKITIGEQKSGSKNSKTQLARPIPKPLLSDQVSNVIPNESAKQLLKQNNPAIETSEDYRITIMATEKEQRRLLDASTYGKFMLREYVLESQPASEVTFRSAEELKVKGFKGLGIVAPKKKPKPPVTETGDTNNTTGINGTTTNNTTVNTPANNAVRTPAVTGY